MIWTKGAHQSAKSQTFDCLHKISRNLCFDRLLKVYKILAEKYRGVISHAKWHEEFDKFSPEHSKVSKLELWWEPFVQSRKCMSLKFTLELCVMAIKNDTKNEEELACRFKVDMRNFTNFDPSTRKSKKFVFYWFLMTKDQSLFELQKYRGVIFNDTEELCKLWRMQTAVLAR